MCNNFNIDAVFLSKTHNNQIFEMTKNAIKSLKDSENWSGDIIIVETENEQYCIDNKFLYDDCYEIFPEEEFNYNRFLNFGIRKTKSDWILLCNNDIIFDKKWYNVMVDIIKENSDILSFCPRNPIWKKHDFLKSGIRVGYDVRGCLIGWCILLHKSIIEKCNLFDETFKFWCQDDDYAMTIKKNDIKHALVSDFIVHHLTSQSHFLLKDRKNLTSGQIKILHQKWN